MNKIVPKHEFEPMAVTTMVEVPMLSDTERAELLASLEQARAEIRSGKGTLLTADELGPWLSRTISEA